MLVYLNGGFLPKAEAKISVEDRGFIFGDGVYEVWRVLRGTLFEWRPPSRGASIAGWVELASRRRSKHGATGCSGSPSV